MIAWLLVGGARIAGRGGIGLGERPRPAKTAAFNEGELAAWLPEKDDLREPGLVDDGGFIAVPGIGVDGIEADGVAGAPWDEGGSGKASGSSDVVVMTEPASDVADPRRAN